MLGEVFTLGVPNNQKQFLNTLTIVEIMLGE